MSKQTLKRKEIKLNDGDENQNKKSQLSVREVVLFHTIDNNGEVTSTCGCPLNQLSATFIDMLQTQPLYWGWKIQSLISTEMFDEFYKC